MFISMTSSSSSKTDSICILYCVFGTEWFCRVFTPGGFHTSHLIWFLSMRGPRACVYHHDKLKFIENGFHIHTPLRFRFWSFYRCFVSRGSHLFTLGKFSFEGTQYFHFLWVSTCHDLSSKIGFMSFGVRMNFLEQFWFGAVFLCSAVLPP